MFERKLTTLGKKSKEILRAFKDKKRMNEEQYNNALQEYNQLVDKKKKATKQLLELPQYIENIIDNTEKNYYKQQIKSVNVKSIEAVSDNKEHNTMAYLREELKKNIGKVVIVQYIIPEKTKKQIIDKIYKNFGNDLPASLLQLIDMLNRSGSLVHETKTMVEDNFSSWWKKYARKWWIDSDVGIIEFCDYKGKLLIYPENENIQPKKVFQYFKEGITNCLYTPILKEAIKRQDEAKSKSTYHNYKKLANQIELLQEEQFETGVPEDYISVLANKLQIDIKIHFPLINKYIEAKSVKKPIMSFVFTNTRLNHVDLNEITYDNNYIEINEEEMEQMRIKLEDQFYIYGKNFIKTLDGNYRVENPLRKAMANFEMENNLYDCKIDDVNDKDLSNFVRNGTHYNETIDFVDIDNLCLTTNFDNIITHATYNGVNVNHYDMKKAYANFWTCSYYNGFLGKITDFRETDKIIGVGYYYIYDVDFTNANEKLRRYNDKMRIYTEGVYPSVELEMLNNHGVMYKIKYGCWGVKTIDFRFSDELMEHKYYALCVGAWDSHNLTSQFSYNGCLEHYQALKYFQPDANLKYFENNEIMLLVDKQHNYHLGHITGFILAYQRLNVIEQLMTMDYDKLIRICVDGIYTCESNVKLCNVFREKDDYKGLNTIAGSNYISNTGKPINCEGLVRKHYDKELHLGAGGCGKTHINLVDKGLVKLLYVSPSWKLAREKEKEYGVKVSVWERLVSIDPEMPRFIRKNYNVLVIDEVSMLTENMKNKIFELYPDCKIIFCGDIGHQLPPFEKGAIQMSKTGFNNIIEYTENRRCKCPELKKILDELRLFNIQNRSIDFIKMYVKSKLGVVKSFDYTINDMILVGTNEQVKKYTDIYIGKFEMEKYKIKANNRLYSNGEIIISNEKPNCSHEIQHAFTCHSIQGETAKHRLFIDLNRIFEKTMIYTAISRAQYLHQIVLVA